MPTGALWLSKSWAKKEKTSLKLHEVMLLLSETSPLPFSYVMVHTWMLGAQHPMLSFSFMVSFFSFDNGKVILFLTNYQETLVNKKILGLVHNYKIKEPNKSINPFVFVTNIPLCQQNKFWIHLYFRKDDNSFVPSKHLLFLSNHTDDA